MCLWTTRVRGVKVGGRNVYLTDVGAKIGFHGPVVPTDQLLGDLRPDLADEIRKAISVIVAHHERKAAQATVSADPSKMWGGDEGSALPDPTARDEDFEEEDGWEDESEEEFASGMEEEFNSPTDPVS